MLPIDFKIRMNDLLKDEYECFERSMEAPEYKALRLNPLKLDRAQFLAFLDKMAAGADGKAGLDFTPVPWEECGFCYEPAGDAPIRPGSSLLHEAGAYYIQEPSAMKPVTLLEPVSGERILDLCAAPGGKSTQIAGYMQGRGLLVCNEIIPSRAAILSQNIERLGVRNALVLNESPADLALRFPCFFDKILVDAPCSGEGMFRKNPEAMEQWSVENVRMCASRQAKILEHAASMLSLQGVMVYSTCTFSREEDEECVEGFLKAHPEFELVCMEKLFPHKIKGEGHFMARLEKRGIKTSVSAAVPVSLKKKKGRDPDTEAFFMFAEQMLTEGFDRETIRERIMHFGDNLYLVPEGCPDLTGLKTNRAGLQLGSYKKDRFIPSHSLAMALKKEEVRRYKDLSVEEARRFIQGMTFETDGDKGYYLICCNGVSLGWGRLAGNIMKNHYPKGLRRNL